MEFHVDIAGREVDPARIESAIRALDPAGIVDVDSEARRLRIAAALSIVEVHGLLLDDGVDLPLSAIEPQPSVCCGGCGG